MSGGSGGGGGGGGGGVSVGGCLLGLLGSLTVCSREPLE